MSELRQCDAVIGNAELVERDPGAGWDDAVFIPNVWCLYDHGRRMIVDSAYFRGPDPECIKGRLSLGADWPTRVETAPEDDYYFLGPVHAHYGHFLLSTFSRLWALRRFGGRRMKLLTYAMPDLAAHPYIDVLLRSVGYSIEDCVTFTQPTLVRSVLVAAPSLEETNFVHQEYARLCQSAAAALLQGTASARTDTPMYLAKYGLKRGVAQLDNEAMVAEALAKRGVDVVFPERLSLPEQIRLFSDRRCIAGLLGSAFHTASFVRERRLMMLAYNRRIYTNQMLVDKAGRHAALYVCPRHGLDARKEDNFHVVYSLRNPEALAEDFLRLFDRFMSEQGVDDLLMS